MPRTFATLFMSLALVLVAATGAGELRAQSLPIPGLPGGLGSIGPTEPAPEPAPEPEAPATPAEEGASPPSDATSSPTQALIDILRDDAAREALIRELEAAASEAPADEPAAPPRTDPPPAEPVASEEPIQTFGDRAVLATREVGTAVFSNLEVIWLRMQRIPSTFELSKRALEGGALAEASRQVLMPAIFIYAVLILQRVLLLPLRRKMNRVAEGATWTKKLILRVVLTGADLVTIPVAVTLGLIFVVVLGVASTNDEGDIMLTDSQALFINAFVAIEGARVALRFILSPRSSSLRIISLPEGGVSHIWRMSWIVLYLIGYGQLFVVPAISDGVSIFVGRAVASVLSAAIVFGLILYLLSTRRSVADWFSDPDSDNPLTITLRPLALLWYWPVLLYLLYLLISVLTRPGNVLLPLLQTTGEVILVVAIGSMVLTGLTERSNRRVRIPQGILSRLPLLEERINQIRPAYLTILRFFVFFVMLLVLLEVLGLQGIGGVISGAVLEQFSSGLFSVVLIVGLVSLAWLAMTSWVDYRLNPFVGSVPTPREITLLTLMKNAVTVALVIVGIITSLAQLGMNVGPLIASAGVIGLAISFGAQRMVEDIFSGVFIQAENAMNVGDVVDVGGTVGTVEKLTVRSVTLRDLSGVVHVIPFSSAAKVSNYMRDFAYHVADIGVAYREDVADVREAMHDAFERLRADEGHAANIIDNLEWFGLNAFGPSELVMRARIKTVPGMQWSIGRAYNAILKDVFDERGIEIPFPHQTLYFGEDKQGHAPPLHMQVTRTRGNAAEGAGTGSGTGPGARADAAPRETDPTSQTHPDRSDAPRSSDHPDEDGR